MATIEVVIDGRLEKAILLDSTGKIPVDLIPKTRYVDVKATKSNNTWYTNSTRYDMTVRILTNTMNGANASYFQVQEGTTGPIFTLESYRVATNIVNSQLMEQVVPSGWRYRPQVFSGRTISEWYEIITE